MDEKAVIEEAVRCRLSLLRFMGDVKLGQILFLDQMGAFDDGPLPSPKTLWIASEMREHYASELEHAPTWPIDDDVLDTLEGVWSEYPSTVAHSTDLAELTPTGFAYLARPVPDPSFGEEAMLSGIFWSVSSGGASEHMADVEEDDLALTLMFLTHSVRAGFKPGEAPVLYPYTTIVWKLDTEDGGHLWTNEEYGELAQTLRIPFIKFFLALLSIIRDRIAVPEDPQESLTKVTKRRIKKHREKFPQLNTEIKVVRYRKQTGSGDKTRTPSPSGRKLKVRFWRQKFWRWQWYPSTQENKPRLIIPRGPVGPEDAPIIHAERVFRTAKPLGPKPVKDKR